MKFHQLLDQYLRKIGCTAKELAQLTGISQSMLSRYRRGEVEPERERLEQIAAGLAQAAKMKNRSLPENFQSLLLESIPQESFDYDGFQRKFDMILSELEVSVTAMSKQIGFDNSHVSRIRNGQRRPQNPQTFARTVGTYLYQQYPQQIERFLKEHLDEISISSHKAENELDLLIDWLCKGKMRSADYGNRFLRHLDIFDLEEFIRSIRFDELKVPSLPFQLPASKHYYGLEQMRTAELDFLKATALSRSTGNVFMCSDMPMVHEQ